MKNCFSNTFSRVRAWFISVLIALFALALPAAAQNTITFSADTTTAIGQAIPVLTWDTSPIANDCTASGSWTGQKGAAGTETLPLITSSATYQLTCQWINDTVTLSWNPPTENTDGSALVDLDGYKIYYGTQPVPPADTVVDVDNPSVTTYELTGLAAGTWHFRATAYNRSGIESDFGLPATRTITGTEGGSEAVSITVNAQPNPPDGLTAQ